MSSLTSRSHFRVAFFIVDFIHASRDYTAFITVK